jgi:hypothetical protein
LKLSVSISIYYKLYPCPSPLVSFLALPHQFKQFFLRDFIKPNYQTLFQVILFDFVLVFLWLRGGESFQMVMVDTTNE